jgi:hypothetical protein
LPSMNGWATFISTYFATIWSSVSSGIQGEHPTISSTENHHLESVSSQIALTSRSLKNLMEILLMHLNCILYKDNKYSNNLYSRCCLLANFCKFAWYGKELTNKE